MAIETSLFDASEFLDSADAQLELLQDAFESGDAGHVAHALGVVARARGMTGIAKEAGVSREALYKALTENGDPKLSTLLGVLKALGVSLAAKPAGSPDGTAKLRA